MKTVDYRPSIFKKLFLTSSLSVLMLAACTKDNKVAEKSVEQQKMEFQARQLEIEKQKLAIEKEKIAYETQKKQDSIAEVEKARAAAPRPQVIRETKTVYVNNTPRRAASASGNYSNAGTSSGTTQAAQPQGMSKAAKGAIIGTVGGAAAGAIISKKNRALGAVIGGVAGGATGYTIGRAQDRKDGRVQPR